MLFLFIFIASERIKIVMTIDGLFDLDLTFFAIILSQSTVVWGDYCCALRDYDGGYALLANEIGSPGD